MKPPSPPVWAVLPGAYHCSVTASRAGWDCPPTEIGSLWVLTLTRTSAANAGEASRRTRRAAAMRFMRSHSNVLRIAQSG